MTPVVPAAGSRIRPAGTGAQKGELSRASTSAVVARGVSYPDRHETANFVRGALCGALVLSLGACGKINRWSRKPKVGSASPSGLSLSGFEGGDPRHGERQDGRPTRQDLHRSAPRQGDKFRVNMPTGLEAAAQLGNVYGIVDTDAKKLYAVLDKQREVVEVDLNKVGDQLKGMTPSAPTTHGAPKAPEYPPKITKTGKTDTVAGFSCENWDIQSTQPGDKSKALVCVSQQGVSWFRLPLTGAPAAIVALGELVDGQHFPLRAIVYAKDGTTEVARRKYRRSTRRRSTLRLSRRRPVTRSSPSSRQWAGS